KDMVRNDLILREPCLFDTEEFNDHLPVKNEVCPEVEMKNVNKCNLTLQL
ncbi:hypothetical protein M9458_009573, partial [Cirrhinus mrigala]